jgi:hypothetical protein
MISLSFVWIVDGRAGFHLLEFRFLKSSFEWMPSAPNGPIAGAWVMVTGLKFVLNSLPTKLKNSGPWVQDPANPCLHLSARQRLMVAAWRNSVSVANTRTQTTG